MTKRIRSLRQRTKHKCKWIYIGDLCPDEVPEYTRKAFKQNKKKQISADLDAGIKMYEDSKANKSV